jgi:lysophospholipase L1-like esterase
MNYSYLALGDSYTIGEAVLLSESFPYQTVQLLRSKNIQISAPEIIAKTGWTTDELIDAISATNFLKNYDFVSLLIGVNNQYRERDINEFENEFELLIKKAIKLADDKAKWVFVLTIPDWGITPFAVDRDHQKIAAEIDAYNQICKIISEKYNCVFIEITQGQREDNTFDNMIATDGLHPSAAEYSKWANKLADAIAAGCSV